AQCVLFPNPGEVKVFNEKNREKMWEFDEVFDTTTNQIQVYNEVSALVTSVMDGFNVCIFAYGQTGSGKTWTMSGPPEDRGVNTRALEELFLKSTQRASEWKDVITVSLLEVYNEEIHDLLSDGGDKLEVKLGPHGNHVPGLVCQNVTNIASVLTLITQADRNRSSTATNMNEHSSRSHMILTVTVLSEYLPTGVQTRGKLNLVDLAGSERINKSGAIGQALTEAKSINKSLSALGDVIAARAAKQAHVPFRNSTLTFLLQDSLSQDSKTLMLVCVSPVLYNSEETFCSLNFASRVRTIELGKVTKTTVGAPAPKKK
ncbi:P-loop containing nucleoside triphosphate hydrolase protein, partial [Ochromonadaceae sp. CCMP2298]